MKKFEAISKNEAKQMNTNQLRDNFLIQNIFIKDKITYNYSYYDRVIIGGVMPIKKKLTFSIAKELGVSFFLERREMGMINIGGPGIITIDSKKYNLKSQDGIYIGVGNKKIVIESQNLKKPTKLYFMSTPGIKKFKIVVIDSLKAIPLKLGNNETLNKRTIYQYIHPNVCESNQLLMGMTLLEPRNIWNTMPAHTHERRMESYFYFNISNENRVFHMMGETKETRHIIIKNEEAVLSPSWSIHSGAGTSQYAFIWAMAGENQTFTDMQGIEIKDLK